MDPHFAKILQIATTETHKKQQKSTSFAYRDRLTQFIQPVYTLYTPLQLIHPHFANILQIATTEKQK